MIPFQGSHRKTVEEARAAACAALGRQRRRPERQL